MPGPRICLYEYCTSGGLRPGSARDAALRTEGRAMARALAEDLAAAGCEVGRLLDRDALQHEPEIPGVRAIPVEPGAERTRLEAAAAGADWALVIAPECEGLLAERFDWVQRTGAQWLGCGRATLELAADKHRTAEWLLAQGIKAPRGWRLDGAWPEDCTFPAVLKPLDGAGADGVRRLERPLTRDERIALSPGVWRVEPWIDGRAVSVAVLCGPDLHVPLAACRQDIVRKAGGALAYVGGCLPLAPALARRARQLAMAAVRAMPDARGYVGVDLVLGADETHDTVIEINPRPTTSYVGLRAACRQNLAQALIDVAGGRPVSLEFDDHPLRFRSDGTIHRGAEHEQVGA